MSGERSAWRRGAAILERSAAHERSFRTTEAGAQAQSLRDRAQELVRIGQNDQAFALFNQAAQCFAPVDDGSAAAAAAHDLGEAYRQRRQGSPAENLRQAERLLRHALRSPERAADRRRHALTASSLASTLRQMAGLPGHDDETLIAEALALQAEAIRISDDFGPFFGDERARFLDTQGNLLLQLGRIDEALQFNRKAVAAAIKDVRRFPDRPGGRDAWATIKCHLLRKLVLRRRRTDLREAIALAEALRCELPDSRKDFLDLCEVEALLALGGPDRTARARALLSRVRVEGVPLEYLPLYTDLLVEVGRRDLALAHVRNALHDALAARRDAKADYLADHASARAYEAGLRLARLHLDGGDPVEPDSEVELWAATPSVFGWQRTALDHSDRIPGLAHGFLGAGATAVLDLAWPVHDLVKALVCEHYSWLRATQTTPGAEALLHAIRGVGVAVAELAATGSPTHETILAGLDQARRRTARQLGVAEAVVPPLPRAPVEQDPATWLDELAAPSHRAAFRWWGSCSLGEETTFQSL